MTRILPLLALALPLDALAEAVPRPGPKDPRVRIAAYAEREVYVIETDLLHATTVHFGRGERFVAVVAGDTESFAIDPIPAANALTIKPVVSRAATNMTILTNRRAYSFHLREGARPDQFFDVHFSYPAERQAAAAQKPGFAAPIHRAYSLSGAGDFRPRAVYDDGRYTYFVFPEAARQPAIFKADDDGRERTVNVTQEGTISRVLGVNRDWTLRIGEAAICVRRETGQISS
ncbi:MAG: TrbG/VirB9 family P-type conjugative transfer protein [Pseudomonadota bacterium]